MKKTILPHYLGQFGLVCCHFDQLLGIRMALFGDLAALFSANPIPVAVAAGVLVTIVSALLIAVVVYIIIKCKQRKERCRSRGGSGRARLESLVSGY